MPSNRAMIVKRAIIDALDALLTRDNFEHISVQDICDKAQVSRTTFYRHFKDKYDLVNWTYENYKDVLNVRGPENETFQLSLSYLLGYLYERQHFYSCALRYTGQNCLAEFMIEIANSYMVDEYMQKHATMDIHERRMVLFNAAGAAEVIRQWLLNGCPDDPCDVVDDIAANTREELQSILEIVPDWRERAAAIGKVPGNPRI